MCMVVFVRILLRHVEKIFFTTVDSSTQGPVTGVARAFERDSVPFWVRRAAIIFIPVAPEREVEEVNQKDPVGYAI